MQPGFHGTSTGWFVAFWIGVIATASPAVSAQDAGAANAGTPATQHKSYDPMIVDPQTKTPEPVDLDITDSTRSRTIPVRIYLPAKDSPAPVVLFSHGLGGNREGSAFLGKHWSARGYVAVFVQHPGSDDSVWRDVPVAERMAEMKKAAGIQSFQDRVRDVPAVLDQITSWNGDSASELKGRFDLEHVGMSGHSFGAITTQAVSGQSYLGQQSFTDPRIKAAVVMSPSGPAAGNVERAFSRVTLPWLLMTGTRDSNPLTGADGATRLVVFPALPEGDKYQLVLHDAEHSAFTERSLPGESGKRNPNHHRAILAISTAFWDTYLRDDVMARAWLEDPQSVRGVLEADDRWEAR